MDQVATFLTKIDWKVALQLGFGGLAGSILTFVLNQRAGRAKQPRLLVTATKTDYAVHAHGSTLKPIQVSYDGEAFEKLMLYECAVRNVSTRSAASAPFLLILADGTQVVDRSCTIY